MNPLVAAVLKTGLVDQDVLEEFRRWGTPVETPDALPPAMTSPEQVLLLLQEALESEGLVVTRETDLEVLHQYMSTQQRGHLHFEISGTIAEFDITFGLTPKGEYIIPWRSETIKEEMANGLTFLLTPAGSHIYFSDVRELFFGDVKSFMVCIPAPNQLKDDA